MNCMLFNPFKRYDARQLLPIGLLATIAGSILAYLFNTRFDGVIDVHTTSTVSFWQPWVENALDIATLFAFLALIGKYLNTKTRLIDILTITFVSRTPLYLLPFLNIQDMMSNASQQLLHAVNNHQSVLSQPEAIILVIAFSILAILTIIWYFVLLYKGYRVAVHAKGTKSIVLFIVAILLAEILSKYVIFTI